MAAPMDDGEKSDSIGDEDVAGDDEDEDAEEEADEEDGAGAGGAWGR